MISVFTPSHTAQWLARAYASLAEQTCRDWEWVLLLNGAAQSADVAFDDPRVKIYREAGNGHVGALKKRCCELASGSLLVEFDVDDELAPSCLEELSKVDGDFLYSNCIEINSNGTPHVFSPFYGWQYRDVEWDGKPQKEAIAPEPYPSNLSRIWYAPNHVRAWRRDFYWKVGGHNEGMLIADDHELILRSYIAGGKFVHIDKPLYIYHIHGKNTWLKNCAQIQRDQWSNYDKYIWPAIERWADEKDLLKIDLGGGIDKKDGYLGYDLQNAEITGDLNERWDLEDHSVGILRAHDIIEHLRDPIHVMNEAYRVLAPNGFFMISVPSALGQGGFCDPTHVSYWVQRSFRYYTEPGIRRYIEPRCTCKFQEMRLRDHLKYDNLPYVEAHLIAVKDAYRLHGAYHW